MSGESFTRSTLDTTPEAFDVRKWRKGAALVTRSVEVYGRPDLLGAIEALDDQIVRAQSADFDNDRDAAITRARELAEQRETLAREMAASIQIFRFRGLRPGELEKINAENPTDDDKITDRDYKVWATQCVEPKGLTWEDFKAMHLGDDESDGFGAYFLQTIARTANLAAQAGGVDVPFSPASSSLTGTSSTN